MQISASLNGFRLAGVISFLSQGENPASVSVYSGDRPEFGGNPTGELLSVVPFSPGVGAVVNGVLHLTQSPDGLILVTGTPSWARVTNGEGTIGWDCSVSGPAGDGELKLNLEVLFAGGSVRIASGTLV